MNNSFVLLQVAIKSVVQSDQAACSLITWKHFLCTFRILKKLASWRHLCGEISHMKMSEYLQNIYRIFFVMLFFTLSGCASAPPKTTPLTEQMIQSNRGDFEGLWNAWIKPQLNSSNIVPVVNDAEQIATEKAVASEFKRFCSAMGGITALSEQRYGYFSMCSTANGDYLGELNTTRHNSGVKIVVNSLEMRKKNAEAAARAEETERKRNYQRLTLDSLSISELSGLINQFNSNDPDNLIPKAKEKLAALRDAEHIRLTALAAERKKQQAIEEAALRTRKERKNIGDQVCISMESTVKKDTGYIILGARHYQSVSGNTRIVGFVERVVDKKIQVRISGINFYGNDGTNEPTDSFSNFNGGSTLRINSVIWDSIYSWDGC